jgi:hypothetical protein
VRVFVSSDGAETITTPTTRHAPARALITLPAGTLDSTLAGADPADVGAGSVAVRAGRRDLTAERAPLSPGLARVLRVPSHVAAQSSRCVPRAPARSAAGGAST